MSSADPTLYFSRSLSSSTVISIWDINKENRISWYILPDYRFSAYLCNRGRKRKLVGVGGFVPDRRACQRNKVSRLDLHRLLFHSLCQGKDLGARYRSEANLREVTCLLCR